MRRVHGFVVVLISTIAAMPCFAQSLSASATGQAPILVASNYVPTETAADGNAALGSKPAQLPSALPDAPSSIQTGLNFQPTKLGFNAPDSEVTLTNQSYDETITSSNAGRMARMINSIVNRMDLSDLATPPGIRGNTGPSGDATFAMNQHLALIGAYEHNSRPSFDTMAFGVAFTFGHNTN